MRESGQIPVNVPGRRRGCCAEVKLCVCSVCLEKGLVSWLQEGKGTCSGSAPRGGGGGTGVND